MFGRLFGSKRAAENQPAAALAAAPALLDQLLEAIADERGIRIEAVALALGSLAGHAAQLATLDALARGLPDYAGLALVQVQGANGESYWFGDAINRPVAEGRYSLWHAVLAASEGRTSQKLPDLELLFSSISARVGSDSFLDQRQAIALYWPEQESILRKRVSDPVEWPKAYGFAFARLVALTGDRFPFLDLAELFMHSAITASKLQV